MCQWNFARVYVWGGRRGRGEGGRVGQGGGLRGADRMGQLLRCVPPVWSPGWDIQCADMGTMREVQVVAVQSALSAACGEGKRTFDVLQLVRGSR
jgi:hypothetical protein